MRIRPHAQTVVPSETNKHQAAVGHWLSRLVAVILLATAALKAISFVSLPPVIPRLDLVLGFVTQRELLLLAIIFELGVALCLLRSRDLQRSALLVLYFATVASLYHLGLLLQGDPPCRCLGVASNWLGDSSKTGTWISRGLLATFWAGSLYVLVCRRNTTGLGHGRGVEFGQAILLAIVMLPRGYGKSVAVEGDYRLQWFTQASPNERTTPFSAVFDNSTIQITTRREKAGPGMEGGPCTNNVYVSREIEVLVDQCQGTAVIPVTLAPAKYAWELGTFGSPTQNAVFQALRCSDLFTAATGSRRLASAFTTGNEPLSLITVGQYAYSIPSEGSELRVHVLVDESLRRTWRSSELLSAGFVEEYHLADAKREMKAYTPGFTAVELRFSRFTNIVGIRFPLVAEFTSYQPTASQERSKGGTHNAKRTAVGTLSIRTVRLLDESVRVPPIASARLDIWDQRLVNTKYHVVGGFFRTNSLDSLAISPLAEADFGRKVEMAEQARRKRIKQRFTAGFIISALLLGPLVIRIASRRKRDGTAVK